VITRAPAKKDLLGCATTHADFDCRVTDLSDDYHTDRIQGRRRHLLLAKLTDANLAAVKVIGSRTARYADLKTFLSDAPAYPAKTAFEIYIPSDEATSTKVLECGFSTGAGMGRNCLRPRRAQHFAAGSQDAALRTRKSRHHQRMEAASTGTANWRRPEFNGRDALLQAEKARRQPEYSAGLEMTGARSPAMVTGCSTCGRGSWLRH